MTSHLVFTQVKFCVFGCPGCGKTSLLRVLSGLDKQDVGEIYINEDPISSGKINMPPESRPISPILNYALFPHMTVYQNIAYGLKGVINYRKN